METDKSDTSGADQAKSQTWLNSAEVELKGKMTHHTSLNVLNVLCRHVPLLLKR